MSATRTAGTHSRGPGRLAAAAVRFWRSVRPTTRRGAALGLVLVLGGAAVLAAAFLVGAAMAWSPYIDSSVHPDSNPRSWAALQPVYADSGSCTECHAPEAAKAAIASHSGIGCESCHGPLRLHVDSSRGTYVATREIAAPTDEVCLRCHTSAAGRPEALRQVIPAEHFAPVCLQCHDPHTAISRRPPEVLHPLANLPPCATCHGPEGFKARNQRHPVVPEDRCLDCHATGRGPEVD
jgi:hypothetical protein